VLWRMCVRQSCVMEYVMSGSHLLWRMSCQAVMCHGICHVMQSFVMENVKSGSADLHFFSVALSQTPAYDARPQIHG